MTDPTFVILGGTALAAVALSVNLPRCTRCGGRLWPWDHVGGRYLVTRSLYWHLPACPRRRRA